MRKRMSNSKSLVEFPISKEYVCLNHAGVGPPSPSCVEAAQKFFGDHSRGMHSFEDLELIADNCRSRFAELIGSDQGEVAFVRNTSHGLSIVAAGLNWEKDDRIMVATSLEYPSNVYPWLDLEKRGIAKLDIVDTPNGILDRKSVEATIQEKTKLLAVSSANYATGDVADLQALGDLCKDHGILFCVDGIQTVGVLPTDVKRMGIHFLSADSHKWMLGIMGIGCLYVDSTIVEQVHPPLLGWRSTTNRWDFDVPFFELLKDSGRFEEGSLPYPLIAGFGQSLQMINEIGITKIESKVSELLELLAQNLSRLGCTVGPDPSIRKHILTFKHDSLDTEWLLEKLTESKIIVSMRRGRIRVSPHFYNTESDMLTLFERVRSLLVD
jgi:cysteine desulfurase/selenocysteine lyase